MPDRTAPDPSAAGATARPQDGAVARIGPNALIQTAHALREICGAGVRDRVFARAGLMYRLRLPPEHMIPETEPAELFAAILAELDEPTATAVLKRAGSLTGDYILANRIPGLAKQIVTRMPAPIAARLLLAAIAKHAWTFSGSGIVGCRYGREIVLEITRNPLATPHCPWHVAVLDRLFQELVSRDVRFAHVACSAAGAPKCRSVLVWS